MGSSTDDTKERKVPCMILVDFKIRNGELHTTGLWRYDIYGAWFPNAVGLTDFPVRCSGGGSGLALLPYIP